MFKRLRSISAATNYDQHFRIDHIKTDLKGRSVRGGATTMGAEACNFVMTTASTAILARLIAPDDFGLIAMVVSVTNFVKLFNDLGLSQATVQRAEINHNQISTLFWLNVALSSVLMLLTDALAPAIAWFYGEPRLTWITLALACGFIISGFAVQHRALLNRQMRYTALASIRITATLVGVVAASISGWFGAGYWALVFMQLATVITSTVGAWIMCGWRPGPPVWDSSALPMLAFGSNLTGFSFFNYFTRNLDNILIGRYWGAQQLGVYSRAYSLLFLPIQQINTPITAVALPALSRLQNNPERYRAYYCKAILLIVTFGMPLVAFLFVTADKAILTLLGPKWMDTVTIFRALAVASFIGTFNVATGWVYISLGRADRQFRWAAFFTSPVNVLIFFISVRWGAVGVATALSLSQPILQLFSVIYCYRGTPLRLTDLLTTLARPAVASLSAAVALIGVNQLFPISLNVVISLLIDCVVYSLFYLSVWMVLPNGRHTLLEMLQLTKELRNRKSK